MTVIDTNFKKAITSGLVRQLFIKLSGRNIMAQFLKVTESTIRMVTQRIMRLPILNFLQRKNMIPCMARTASGLEVMQTSNNLLKLKRKQRFGTEVKKDISSMYGLETSHGKRKNSNLYLKNVLSAEENMEHTGQEKQNIALRSAQSEDEGLLKWIGRIGIALFAINCLQLLNIVKPRRVVKNVQTSHKCSPKKVYNLTIQDDSCYYANGILVSNSHSADAFGYMAIVYATMTIDGTCLGATGPNPERWDDDYEHSNDSGVTNLLGVSE